MKLIFATAALTVGLIAGAVGSLSAETTINGSVKGLLSDLAKKSKGTPAPSSSIAHISETGYSHGQAIERLKKQSPNATPFEILKQEFDNSKDLIQLKDVGGSGQQCVGANTDSADPYDMDDLDRAQSNKVIVPATPDIPAIPGKGPLFPETPAIPGKKARISSKDFVTVGSVGQEYLDGAFDYIVLANTPSELDFTINDPGQPKTQPYNLVVRKDKDLISFSVRMRIGTDKETDAYGYCWKK